ncbi:TAFII28-domain-containing protein [Violaceomyces palustris]|uniref:TAFII28-domain-containing protein n=1 Tax=Violaceomyces palustris TaxID=1673888 RepID=A0ACD0P793_9BASI|nr:TAFII28-domain-containing protein [Violaceomyces palustris]
MSEDQQDRHMASRRGALNKSSVRKLVNHVLSQSVSQHIAMVASGVGKVFVGEMVEKARAVQAERGESGPLRPHHLYMAHRLYKMERERPGYYPPGTNSGAPGLGKRRRMF